MDRIQVESTVISLICFMVVSARGLVDEPKLYGPMRLMELTQKLTDFAQELGVGNELLTELEQRIEDFPLDAIREYEDDFISFLDDLVVLLATWVADSQWFSGT